VIPVAFFWYALACQDDERDLCVGLDSNIESVEYESEVRWA